MNSLRLEPFALESRCPPNDSVLRSLPSSLSELAIVAINKFILHSRDIHLNRTIQKHLLQGRRLATKKNGYR